MDNQQRSVMLTPAYGWCLLVQPSIANVLSSAPIIARARFGAGSRDGGWLGIIGGCYPSCRPLSSIGTITQQGSGDARRLYGRLMHVDLVGSSALQDITSPLDFVGSPVRDQQELSRFDGSLVFHYAILRDTEAE